MPFCDVDRNNVESVYLLLHTLETVTVPPENKASAYDCTGQRFTNWCKLFRRHGHWYAYHSVGVDV